MGINDENTVAVTFEKEDLNTETVGIAVVDAIASFENVDPTDIEPLYYSIDIESIANLIRKSREKNQSSLQVSFVHNDKSITIDANPELTITVIRL